MTYQLEEQYNSKNQVPGASADSIWHLGARQVRSITIHHWGNKGQLFDTVRDFLCTNNTPTSAHYVVEDGRVSCIVSPDDCAFHAGNAEGNSHSIGIECRPEATDGDYATIAELIRTLRGIYGDVPIYPHNHWYNTACPGDYDLDRLDTLARSGIAPQGTITTASAIINQLQEAGVALEKQDLEAIQSIVQTERETVVKEVRAQAAFVLGELAQKIANSEYQIKVFAQASDNFTGDRVINDNRAVEGAK